ncbi:hypothetical protein LJC02_01855 [Breznakia sp. OttesenSCG-928-G09]|nr:hypothetical protein [Breznakia sp. OttesenSCG-928-G09]
MDAVTALKKLGYTVDDSTHKYIPLWEEMYKGNIEGFHKYSEWNGKKLVNKKRKTLGMPKKACEDWADNIFNDNVYITVDDDYQETFDGCLKLTKFRKRFPYQIELSFGLGTGALVEFKDTQGNPVIDMIRADMIYPLEVENGEIVSCAFASEQDGKLLYLNIHKKLDNGNYLIENRYYKQEKKKLLPFKKSKVKESYISKVKMFQIIKPAIVNSMELNSSMGMSVYAKAEDEMKSTDIDYDSLDNEIEVGKKRQYVKVGGLGIQVTEDGETVPIFDNDQTTFYILPGEEGEEGTVVQETQSDLRIQAITDALQTNLNLFGRKVGLGDDYYSFKDGSVYTNTSQVISSNSRFYKTLKKHEKMIQDVIVELVEALYYLQYDSFYLGDVTIDFDDSIVEDSEAIQRQALLEKNSGLIDNVQYYMDVYKLTEDQAIEFNKKIQERLREQTPEEPPIEE